MVHTMKYILPKTAEELKKVTDSAVRSAKTMREKIQLALVAILYHAHKHGDYTSASRFANEFNIDVGMGVNRKAIVDFFEKFGGLILCTEDANKNGFTSWEGKEFIRDNFQDAQACMWWTLKPEAPFKALSMEASALAFIAQIRKTRQQAVTLKQEGKEDEASQVVLDVEDSTMSTLMALLNLDLQPIEEEANDAEVVAELAAAFQEAG